MCGNKADIVFSTEKPKICQPCKARVMELQLSRDFLPTMEKELPRMKKALYYRLSDFVKKKPILAIFITSLSAVLLSMTANLFYDILKTAIVPKQEIPKTPVVEPVLPDEKNQQVK